jgi:hypothetical protein
LWPVSTLSSMSTTHCLLPLISKTPLAKRVWYSSSL